MKPKRTRQQRAIDSALVERMHIEGYTTREISKHLSKVRPYTITQQQVSYDLQQVEAMWLEQAQSDVGKAKAKELRGLQAQENELWRAWEKSKKNAEKKVKESGIGGSESKGGSWAKERKESAGQCGEAAYMKLILDIRERRAKLLGLDAPAKQELSGPDGGPIKTQASSLSDEELAKLIEEQRRIDAEQPSTA